MTFFLKSALVAAGVLAGGAVAQGDPINRYTITGRSSAAAIAQDVPLNQTPRPAEAASSGSTPTGAAVDGSAPAAAPAKPRVVRYGLLGLSWRTE
ncbi:hypothetical protein IHQ68_05295 [Chelatococcus sambhunathii]|uniref:Uncharacterized protein n=1 Tax=Chelatococcus sambhunathii TaxID=363953 RepID=A0ABU1DDM2_9HYPH|nr:hypothetical protein [Chelatococcus sambhunathii]MDR4306035.1 hypothetical protein [Chelatococcus sambhunathii]